MLGSALSSCYVVITMTTSFTLDNSRVGEWNEIPQMHGLWIKILTGSKDFNIQKPDKVLLFCLALVINDPLNIGLPLQGLVIYL